LKNIARANKVNGKKKQQKNFSNLTLSSVRNDGAIVNKKSSTNDVRAHKFYFCKNVFFCLCLS